MIPSLLPRAWALYVALGTLVFGGWVGYRVGAYGVQAEVARGLAEAVRERDGAIGERDRALQQDARIALGLASLRTDLAQHAGQIEAAVDTTALTREVRRVVNGKESVCDERDAHAYRVLNDAAVLGTPAPTTAAAPGVVPGAVQR